MAKEKFELAPLPLRLILGFGFVYHGYPKAFTASGQSAFHGMLVQIGVPLPIILSWAVAFLELLGGLAILLGVFVSLAAVLLTCEMFVALLTVHLPAGFNFIHITGMTDGGPRFGMPGYEVNLLYIAALVSLILSGPGAFSLDHAITRKRRQSNEQTVIEVDFPDRGLDEVS